MLVAAFAIAGLKGPFHSCLPLAEKDNRLKLFNIEKKRCSVNLDAPGVFS